MAMEKFVGKVEYKDNLAGQVWLTRISLDREVDFLPGQFVSVKVNGAGERRAYSVASMPREINGDKREYIDILIDVSPMGVGSRFFLGLSVGDSVEMMGFAGRFVLQEAMLPEATAVFVATGTGIAPIRPMIENLLLHKKHIGKIVLIWGMRKEPDLYWIEELERLERDFENFQFQLVLSQPSENWPGKQGHVGDVAEKLDLDWGNAWAYLCGAPAMVEEIKNMFLDRGVEETRVVHEKYG